MNTYEIQGKKFVTKNIIEVTDQFMLGDAVRILIKEYSNDFRAYSGYIVAIDPFINNPSVTVLYLKTDYSTPEVKIKTITNLDKETEIMKVQELDETLNRMTVLNVLNEKINTAKVAYESLAEKKLKIEEVFNRIFNTK